MAIIRLKGILTETGEIKVDLPENWQPGEIEVLIPTEEMEWTEEELAELEELMKPEPVPASQIVTAEEIGSWSDIEDSVAFVEELRRKRRERNQW